MKDFGFFRVCAYVPEVSIGNPEFNSQKIIEAIKESAKNQVDCIVFPELSITGYTCGDLFEQALLNEEAEAQIRYICEATSEDEIVIGIGCPVLAYGKRYNCAVIIQRGKVRGIVPKSYLPNYGEFYEKRWFHSGLGIKDGLLDFVGQKVPFGTDLIFNYKNIKIGVEICEDLWVPQPPSGALAMAGAEVILNLSASDDLIGKHDYLINLISQQSARCRCVYVYSSAGWGESSTDLVFTGKVIIGYDGKIYGGENDFITHSFYRKVDVDIEKLKLERAKFTTFTETDQNITQFRFVNIENGNNIENRLWEIEADPYPFVPSDEFKLNERCTEIINIQSYGLMRRLKAIGCEKAIIGISGGLDSTLALLVTVNAFDRLKISRKGIIGVTMPGLATTSRTKNNAYSLMESLGVTTKEIPINLSIAQHFKDIQQDPAIYDATYENSQARERTQILMDLANKENGIVIGTGDMSELALGWCTYNGDQMSMYGVNSSVPKTLVRHLVKWFATKEKPETATILRDICDTPISPELIPSNNDDISQKTEDLVGPYELHDFFLYNFLRNSFSPTKIYWLARKAFEGKYEDKEIMKWLKIFIKRFFSQQFKRSCMPDGPKVGSVSLSPRGDWRMPSDASCELWLKNLEDLNY